MSPDASGAAPHIEAPEARVVVFELAVAPEAAATLLRHPALAGRRLGQARSAEATVVFHDTAEGALAAEGLALAVEPRGRGAVQRLLRGLPGEDARVEPARPPAALAQTRLSRPGPDAASLVGLIPKSAEGMPLPAAAAAAGRRHTLRLAGGMTVTLFAGQLRAVAAERDIARLTLAVPEQSLAEGLDLLRALAADRPVTVPAASLAEEARAVALGVPPRPLWRGPPDLTGAATVEDGARRAIGQLTLALLAAAPVAEEGSNPEGVHQARVAIRRLRSALTLFRPAIGCAAVTELKDRLGTLARALGPARDWDVFIAGALGEIVAAFPQEPALASLARAAEAARESAYAEVRATLAAPFFRLLTLDLAAAVAAPPWRGGDAAEAAVLRDTPLEDFAAAALNRRYKRLMRAGEGFAQLDIPALHRLRIQAKRMRYAGELFGGLYGAKKRRRFQKAVGAVQDALGHLNDTAVAAGLMRTLAKREPGRAWAAGVVQGWVAAKAAHAREDAAEAWETFAERAPFWDG
ncbi:CHAD domain-containing protein [Elioraea tepidiphila]|uniref:CYTH and CHAD domain-containing protein n=1 Tax=Elioraea tepidiphila TaxID=457934 RepID=UPI00037133A0|nr:CHAD domain-containing protein [Elioraea tepidiphila]